MGKTSSPLIEKHGGYRKLHSFTFATMIHLETISFCKRFVPWQEDQLGKTAGQMIGAARSGRQNIIEGSERSATSKETEIKLTDVARASLAELLGDYEIFLADRGEIPWSKLDPERVKLESIMLSEFKSTGDPIHEYWKYYHGIKPLFAHWFDSDKCEVVANAMVIIIQRCMAMLSAQIRRQSEFFLKEGGFREKMYNARIEEKEKEEIGNPELPKCPECGKPMRKRTSQRGDFWGCSAYPECRGIRTLQAVTKN